MNKSIKVVLVMSILILTELLAAELSRINNQKESANVINTINKEMKKVFNDALITAEVLKEVVVLSENSSISLEAFNKLSQTLLLSYSNVDSLLYLPQGVVTLVYPYEENKRAIGHNVLQDKSRRLGAERSINCGKNTLIGPVKLVQNGKQAFILRKAITNESGFIGFSSSIIYLGTILNSLENILEDKNISNYSIVGFDPDNRNFHEKVISSKGHIDRDVDISIVTIFNTNWQVSISPNDTGLLARVAIFSTLFITLLLIISPVKFFNQYRRSEKQRFDLQNEAYTDFLTGLMNRRGLENRFYTLKEQEVSGSIAVFDIDFFKTINDTYGHEIGDVVLVQFALLCGAKTDLNFTLSRTGGEEFVLLMPSVKRAEAMLFCEELRQEVAATPILINDLKIEITVSIGVAHFDSTDGIRIALAEADEGLYKAKQFGRNRVYVKD
ncbi:TPA: sensor domain-containing diguanylate cyclase [Vibrio harveyi]|uniref:sensor domain-containing diguanylate cyclase n=1 Tax=Vibrio harveyi TaxID=669 RepID=UPI0023803FF0|nr:diguanylate cyclase [Vibrio harveyi]HDM8134443.1 sensor domain-containing diguanylate cyclase [Vibrio harveyi]